MGIICAEKRLGIINVEQIAGTLIVQHYYTKIAAPDHVSFVSEVSEGFLLRTIPFAMKVWWDMQIASNDDQSIFTCTIGFDAPAWVEAAGAIVRNGHQLHEHLKEKRRISRRTSRASMPRRGHLLRR